MMRAAEDVLIEMYRRMVRIRRFEEAACRLLSEGGVFGAVHTSIGQEAAAAGACMALRAGDYIAGNHRSHGHPIAKGAALGPLMAELMGHVGGVCRGRGGSMHLADFSAGSIGESGIVGAGIALATGAALSARVRGTDQVAVSFFGDGASNEGVFHECLNMAALWRLPVVFFCENNLYAATTPAARSSRLDNIADRAAAYAMPGVVVDGQDAVAVYEATLAAAQRARQGEGPTLIEAKTYRYREHAEGFPIPGSYRSDEEIEQWRRRDPIAIHRERLISGGVLTAAEADAIEREVAREIEEAEAFGRESPEPDPSAALEFVYATDVRAPSGGASASEGGGTPKLPAGTPWPDGALADTGSRNVSAGGARHLGRDGAGAADSRAGSDSVRELTGLGAIYEAIAEEMARDERVILIGEDIALYGETPPLAEFADRIWSTPISENGFTGMAVGAAMTGLRPIVDLTVANFAYLAMDAIVNQAAKMHAMTGGQTRVPLVIRASMWHGHSIAAQHSDRPYPMFLGVPGLKIVVPATPADLKGLLEAAVRDDDPVLVFDELSQWFESGPVPEGEFLTPLGRAEVKRSGDDVTIVAIGSTVPRAMAAAEQLAAEGISVEVVDPRTLAPLDRETILASVRKTGRAVVVEVANKTGGAGAEIAAIIAEDSLDRLHAPVRRVATADVHIPYSPSMEMPLYPSAESIAAAVREVAAVP
ncbi:MAG: dehydrogenase [Deltaproteobacteria bacterium]|nr:MAG: dehydrogenase [Deltaproteobacteria bacterium]